MSILAGDIGGTSTRLAWYVIEAGRLRATAEAVYPSQRHSGLDQIVARFVEDQPRADMAAACFGIAGPIRGRRVATPNLPWVIEAAPLARQLRIDTVELINDLEANAWGVAALAPEDLLCLNAGQPSPGNAAVISAGTGLGQAGLYWDGSAHRPFATEGGHCDFAPRNELEFELLRYLGARIGRVSVERIVSGPGLVSIYRFFQERDPSQEPVALDREMRETDPAAAIWRAATTRESPSAAKAVDLFVDLYGAEAGNLALKMLATAGLYVGGGIAPKIVERLREGAFLRAFTDKGRMRPLLEAIPVHVILNEKTALLGAARCAADRHGLM